MILSDVEIEILNDREENNDNELITPYNPEQINPASYDVTLGDTYIADDHRKFCFNNTIRRINNKLILHPGQFVLAVSKEFFKLPNDIVGQFALKSTSARCGLEHSMAGYCDPGWHGCLTMELKNINQHREIHLVPGMRIGQMLFIRMSRSTTRPYHISGSYFNDRQVKGPKSNELFGE